MRGEGTVSAIRNRVIRITPACAGRRSQEIRRSGSALDHPRVCGEKRQALPRSHRRAGSPPRVRGEAYCHTSAIALKRITPACAGRRARRRRTFARRGDHPRVCGEKSRSQALLGRLLGSPPRVRGEDCVPAIFKSAVGITPACAGRRLKKSPI